MIVEFAMIEMAAPFSIIKLNVTSPNMSII